MPARSRSKGRCPRCEIHILRCFCDQIPLLNLETKVIILMHVRERTLITNSARLAILALRNSDLRLRGDPKNPMSTEGLVPNQGQALFLYPEKGAQELTPDYVASLPKPIHLIVPDGNWKQASKVGRRVLELASIPRVTLPPGGASEYMLRKAPQAHMVSTFEAIARALGIIEGPQVQQTLEKIFRLKVERTLQSRGTRPTPH